LVIRYTPPKSRIWGHQVGRLPATAIVERSMRFLDTQCTIIKTHPSDLTIGWNQTNHQVVSEIVGQIDHQLGQSTTTKWDPDGSGSFQQRRWEFAAEALPVVGPWFDKLAALLKTQQVFAQSSSNWIFAWRDEAPPLKPMHSAGGMFAIHLGQPHVLTTMFSFRDLDKYASIKSVLHELDLVELSDKHLRPKIGAKRQTK